MPLRIPFALFVAALLPLSCGERSDQDAHEIRKPSIGVYPARRMRDETSQPPLGWEIVTFHGEQGRTAVYLVEHQPIFTEQNIVSSTPFERKGFVGVALDAAGTEALSEYSADTSHQNQPVATKIGARWVSFPILLAHIRHGRSILGGLTEEEVESVIEAFASQ